MIVLSWVIITVFLAACSYFMGWVFLEDFGKPNPSLIKVFFVGSIVLCALTIISIILTLAANAALGSLQTP